MKKMNEKIKKSWIRALTSGKYKQGKGLLKKGEKFCCLGVLCDLHRKQTNKDERGKWIKSGQQSYYYFGADLALPSEVINWSGIGGNGSGEIILSEKEDVEFVNKLFRTKIYTIDSIIELGELNDFGRKFSTIAKLIERFF